MSTVTIETKRGGYIRFDDVTNVCRGNEETEITEVKNDKVNIHIIDNASVMRFSHYDVKSNVSKPDVSA